MTTIKREAWRLSGNRVYIVCPSCEGETFLDDYAITMDGRVFPKFECVHEKAGNHRRIRCKFTNWLSIEGWPFNWQKRAGQQNPEKITENSMMMEQVGEEESP